MRNGIRVSAALALTGALLVGCAATGGIGMSDRENTGFTAQGGEYTDNQRSVLLASGADEERLERGALLNVEKKLLEFLRFAETFMAERYPQEQFAFTGLDNSSPHRTSVVFQAQSASHPGEGFAVRVVRGTDGRLSASESYFSVLRRDELNRYAETLLAGLGMQAAADLDIVGLTDVIAQDDLPLDALLGAGLELTVSGFVFVPASAQIAQRKAQIEQALGGAGLTGGFSLRAVTLDLPQALGAPRTDRSFVAQEALIVLSGQKGEVK